MQNHWDGYLKALSGAVIPAPYPTSDSKIGVSGFMDLTPKQPDMQARCDAMSGSSQGVAASDGAIAKNMFKAESMPIIQKHPYMK
jgi:hypothetical protein